ncbi:MbtH family protein [Rhizobium laguerreae]|uniref:MbtH family protein n=1 Tax=Rhizobium laguerreae TaxID=1076926 RepID=UPI0028C4F27D|nr:MbtH family protein [Rhizobium laguerreae]
MPNPFDDEAGVFLVLKNPVGQYSLWPQFANVPDGWSVALGPEARGKCIDYINDNWKHMRPLDPELPSS